ncbi:MAG: rod shape-determining protein MreD [Flavobacteriales bacterium CG_4_9_14_3_um_filter_40_17]|nr:MAG: rod shape-determining protein MreD [Flavobacteriales bacterium CG_4_9_14_3_um_filter_40_17]
MKNDVVQETFKFIVLILAQVLLFNRLVLFGHLVAYVYVVFLILYPVKERRNLFLFISFLLGLAMDMFMNSGGIHATACLLTAYFRPKLLRFVYGVSFEHQTIKVALSPISQLFSITILIVLVHHSVLFFLEAFSINLIFYALKKTILTGIFTTVLSLILITLFSKQKR